MHRTEMPVLWRFDTNTCTMPPLLGTTISQDLKWDNHIDSIVKKGPADVVLPSPAEEVQPATGAAETVLLCHHWICPLHVNNCLVQLRYQIWPQKTMEGSPDCWVNHWYNPPYSPRTVHLHLVILQTLLSKATYNWGIHKAIHPKEADRHRKCS